MNGYIEVKYSFTEGEILELSTLDLENPSSGRVDDGLKHILDINFFIKFSKIYLDNKLDINIFFSLSLCLSLSFKVGGISLYLTYNT